ncbi:C4-dicarboxylate ABC transporter permease [Allostella sp. ATCC 35155]|nr:C4-dicarboxylate ABC transporter permease [Stella sp. ATCC 35155]
MTEHDQEAPGRPDPGPRVPIRIEEALTAAAMAALCLITFGNVVVRYLTNISFAFTEEYSIALMVIVTLLGSAVAFTGDRHIRVTFLLDRLTPGARRWAELLVLAACIVMFALLVRLGGRLAWDEYRFEETSPGLGIPTFLYTMWLPILSAVIVLRLIGRAIRVWRAR